MARLNASTIAQVGYQLSARTSLRSSGGYGTLLFRGSELANNSQINGMFGVDHVLSPVASISLNYAHFRTLTSGFGGSQSHSLMIGYSRRLSRRLMVQLPSTHPGIVRSMFESLQAVAAVRKSGFDRHTA